MKKSYLFKNQIYFSNNSNESTNKINNHKIREWYQLSSTAKILMIIGGIIMIVCSVIISLGFSPYYLIASALFTIGSALVDKTIDFLRSKFTKKAVINDKEEEINNKTIKELENFCTKIIKQIEKIKKNKYEDNIDFNHIEKELEVLNENIEKTLLIKTKDRVFIDLSLLGFARAISHDIYRHINKSFNSQETSDALIKLNEDLKVLFPESKPITLNLLKKNALLKVLNAFFNETIYYSDSIHLMTNHIINNKGEINKQYLAKYRIEEDNNGKKNYIKNSLEYRVEHSDKLNEKQKNQLIDDINDKKDWIYDECNIYELLQDIIFDFNNQNNEKKEIRLDSLEIFNKYRDINNLNTEGIQISEIYNNTNNIDK